VCALRSAVQATIEVARALARATSIVAWTADRSAHTG